MHVLIVTDAYFPSRTSVAVLLYELAQTFIQEKVKVSIIVPSINQIKPIIFMDQEGCQIISVRALQTKDLNYVRRTLNEFMNPWIFWRILRRSSQFSALNIDGVIWYSPSIFWGPLVKRLKQYFQCRSYLILRDVFPDWALHLGIIKKGLPYLFLKMVERYQYEQADTIGIQSPNNLLYFQQHQPNVKAKLEVLWNWARSLDTITKAPCSIDVSKTPIAGRIIFVYAGNIGVAQGIHTFLNLIESLKDNSGIGFLIVGRGSEAEMIKQVIHNQNLHNAIVFDEIASFEIPGLFSQCHAGLIFLDKRHRTHNIPGKFVTYLQSGVPVLAIVNPGNDLLDLIPKEGVGIADDGDDLLVLIQKVLKLAKQVREDVQISDRCRVLANSLFESRAICEKILSTFGRP